jgi:hypothetical protein
MHCPRCGLFHSPEAPRCDCGCPLDGALPFAPKRRPRPAPVTGGRHLRIALLISLAAGLAVVRILAAVH